MERCINFRDEKLQCHEENFSILIYRFNTSPLNIPTGFFRELGKLFLKFIGRAKD